MGVVMIKNVAIVSLSRGIIGESYQTESDYAMCGG